MELPLLSTGVSYHYLIGLQWCNAAQDPCLAVGQLAPTYRIADDIKPILTFTLRTYGNSEMAREIKDSLEIGERRGEIGGSFGGAFKRGLWESLGIGLTWSNNT
jgi:hypothetical protein